MATRSFLVTLINSVLQRWDRAGLQLLHGEWSKGADGIPSEHIPAAHIQGIHIIPGDDWFMSDSGGGAKGTEGWVEYTTQGVNGTLHIYWDNRQSGRWLSAQNGSPISGNELCQEVRILAGRLLDAAC